MLIATITLLSFIPAKMLDRTRDADRDVELGRHDLAGLADLVVVGREPRVDGGARRADRCPEHVGETVEQLEVLAGAQAAAARDDDAGGGEIGAFGLVDLAADDAGEARGGNGGTMVTGALPPSAGAAAKAVVRTVSTRLASRLFTVARTLPA